MSKNQFTGTATQPQCNRKFCQFNNDQYCTLYTTSNAQQTHTDQKESEEMGNGYGTV